MPAAAHTHPIQQTRPSAPQRTFLLTVFGLLLWLIHGLARGNWALIVTDVVSLILAVTILGLKLRYG